MKNKINLIINTAILFFTCYILELNLTIPIFLSSLYAYIRLSTKNKDLPGYKTINLTLLFVIVFVASYLILKYEFSIYYMPFSLIPMLSVMLFCDLNISLLLTVASSISIANITGNNLSLAILFLISGIFSSILVRNAHKRIEIIRAGLSVGIIQALTLLLMGVFTVDSWTKYLTVIVNSIASSVIVIGILPVFEYLFKTVTNISLLELADFNHPLLQRMILEAPGTYHHSLIVGNLSEAAARAIGAQALLARIGAYYHDIGKLQKPDYFSENQGLALSRHDALSPDMSKMVIMHHVKEGIELAKKYKLNPCLVDFIAQHHGNSLVYYFYRRALENLEEDQKIEEEGFRYPGPKPNKKETAIVLLADSVEAATRTLKDPAPSRITETVHKIINNKFIDEQLDECDLTLKDLEKIANVFIHILSGIYHSRINYPREEEKSQPQ